MSNFSVQIDEQLFNSAASEGKALNFPAADRIRITFFILSPPKSNKIFTAHILSNKRKKKTPKLAEKFFIIQKNN